MRFRLIGSLAAAANRVEIGMFEYGFRPAGTAKAGPLTLNLTNEGKEMHQAIVGRLDAGKTLADVQAEVAKGEEGPPPPWLHDDPGDLSLLSPGEKFGITIDASQTGTYVLLCFVPAPDGQPHVAKGMASTFEVTGLSDAPAPVARASFSFDADSVTAPSVASGTTTVAVRNGGQTGGDFNVIALEPGKKLSDIDKWFESPKGPPPAVFLGGTHAIEPGKQVTMTLNLDPGTYTAVATFEEPEHKDVTATFTVS